MSILETVLLIIFAVIFLAILVWFIIKAIKNKWLSQLMEVRNAAIREAEDSDMKGEDKKKFVLDKIKTKADELKIPYELIKKAVSVAIDLIVADHNIFVKK